MHQITPSAHCEIKSRSPTDCHINSATINYRSDSAGIDVAVRRAAEIDFAVRMDGLDRGREEGGGGKKGGGGGD